MSVLAAFGWSRLALAAFCSVALVARYLWGLGSATFTPGNFFAYLTIQSNIAWVVVTAFAGVLAVRAEQDPPWLATVRAAVLSATVSSGIVFALIIQQAGVIGLRIDVPWSDQVLHFWLPALAIIDWIVAPGRGRAMWRAVVYLIVFTIGWGIVTLIRGAFVGWYPYFFLDPDQLRNAGQFFLFSGIALVVFAGIATGIVALGRREPLGRRWTFSWPLRRSRKVRA